MVFEATPIGTETEKINSKHARKHRSRERPGTYAGRGGPWGGHARDQKAEKGDQDRSQLDSLNGKVGKLESLKGSNRPEGQRPGEL